MLIRQSPKLDERVAEEFKRSNTSWLKQAKVRHWGKINAQYLYPGLPHGSYLGQAFGWHPEEDKPENLNPYVYEDKLVPL